MSLRYNLYRLKYRYAPVLNLKMPVDVSLELSSHCNMNCSYCYHASENKLPFTKGFMSLGTAGMIIKQAADLGVHSIKFNYRGEATLNPNFKEICKMANDRAEKMTFIDRVLNSNFKFPKAKRWDIFEGISHLTKVKVSFDSFTDTVFNKQRSGGNWDITYSNIETFHDCFDMDKTELVIQAVRTDLNKDEDLEGLIKWHFPKAKASIRDVVSGRKKEEIGEIRKRDFKARQSCIQAHARLIFSHDGSAHYCCPDLSGKLVKHNIHDMSLIDIFNSRHAKGLRKSLKDGSAFKQDPCKTCPSHESFKGYKHPWGS